MEMLCSPRYNSVHFPFFPTGDFTDCRWLLFPSAPKGFPVFNLETKHPLITTERNVRKKEEVFLQSRGRRYSCIIKLLRKWDGKNINKFISLTLLLNVENSAQINTPSCPGPCYYKAVRGNRGTKERIKSLRHQIWLLCCEISPITLKCLQL